MLILPNNPRWKDGRPALVDQFRSLVASRLGDAWTVKLTAYDDACGVAINDIAHVSAAIHASCDAMLVSISRHRGFDTVLVELPRVPPHTVPFEDLAAALCWVPEDDVLALADQEPPHLQPLLPFDDVLSFLDQSRELRADELRSDELFARLRNIANRFGARIRKRSRQIRGSAT